MWIFHVLSPQQSEDFLRTYFWTESVLCIGFQKCFISADVYRWKQTLRLSVKELVSSTSMLPKPHQPSHYTE